MFKDKSTEELFEIYYLSEEGFADESIFLAKEELVSRDFFKKKE